MPEFFIKKELKIEVRIVCGDKGTADVLASCLDEWCVDLTKPLPNHTGYELQPRGSFFHIKEQSGGPTVG